MADYRITCIIKPNVNSSHEHITHIGNPTDGWNITREQAIKYIESKAHTFYVLDRLSNKRANVGVRYPTDGRLPFLQTYSDQLWNNNLLSLNQCSVV